MVSGLGYNWILKMNIGVVLALWPNLFSSRMLSRKLPSVSLFGRHLMSELGASSSLSSSLSRNLVIADRYQFLVQIRRISFFSKATTASAPVTCEIPVSGESIFSTFSGPVSFRIF